MKGKNGTVGKNAIWDGPLSQSDRPHSKGSSSGITGMKLNIDLPMYKAGPITQVAKK
jgi:hypothetical protein